MKGLLFNQSRSRLQAVEKKEEAKELGLRILRQGWDEGQYLKLEGIVYKPISHPEGLAIIQQYHKRKTGQILTEFQLKSHYGHLWIDETDIGLEWIIFTPDGRALHWDRYVKIKETGGNPHEDRSWVGKASDYIDRIPTRMMGCNYLFPEDRPEYCLSNTMYENWITDEATRNQYEKFFVKTFIGVRYTKDSMCKLNRCRNSGKTTSSMADKKLLGSYAVDIPKSLLHPRNEEEWWRYEYRNKAVRAKFYGETDESDILNETGLKMHSGGDEIFPPFKKVKQVPFKINSKLIGGGSNEPFSPQDGKKFKSWDRFFYIPFGVSIPQDLRQIDLEARLLEPIELGARFSYLVDKWMPVALTAPILKTQPMRLTEMYARLVHESVHLFLDVCCIVGVSERFQTVRRMTCDQVQSFYAYFVRAIGVRILRELRFDRDENGIPLTDSQLINVFNMADPLEFKRTVDKRIGPANEVNRMSSGRSWPNLIVKFPLIFFAGNPQAQALFASADDIFQLLDRIQTEKDAVNAVQEYTVLSESAKYQLIEEPKGPQWAGFSWQDAAVLTLWRQCLGLE